MIDLEPARRLLHWARDAQVFPAAVVDVGSSAASHWREAFGTLSYGLTSPPATDGTVFDLASLTKVIATATIAMRLVDRARLDLDTPVRRHVGEWRGEDRDGVTIRDVLEHASGLPSWLPLFQKCRGRQAYREAICSTPLAYVPRSRSEYSDLGFILLGFILEDLGERPLDELLREALPNPDGNLGFLPPDDWRSNIAPARVDDDRGPLAPGDVDDANAWALGGVAGHAGLFGTAAAVGQFARRVLQTLNGAAPSAGGLAKPATLRRFVEVSAVPGSSRALAWDTMRHTSSCGTRLSAKAIGHTGFTGTSLWIDPAADVYIVLLTNRVHPRATDAEAIQALRRGLHDALMDSRTS